MLTPAELESFHFEPGQCLTAALSSRSSVPSTGSGITPILSIAATTLEEQPESRFTLVYGKCRMSSAMFNEALQDLKDRYRQAQEVDLLQGRI